MSIELAREEVSAEAFIAVLERSGLGARRPVADRDRVARMLRGANLIVTARRDGELVGVARAITDFAYCCYLSDLAVDRACQGLGIGRRLVAEVQRLAGEECTCLLLSAPDSMAFYRRIGMEAVDNGFLLRRRR